VTDVENDSQNFNVKNDEKIDLPVSPQIVGHYDYHAVAKVNENGALMMEGFDQWVDTLKQVGFKGTFMHVADEKTNTEYLIKKITK